ncbi:MAG: hypothetical protein RLY58_54 [Pseudomonadota bacterium]
MNLTSLSFTLQLEYGHRIGCCQALISTFLHITTRLQAHLQAGFDELVQITVKHCASIGGFDAGAQVFNA